MLALWSTWNIWNIARYSQHSDLHPEFALCLPESPFRLCTSHILADPRPHFDALRDSRFATLVLIPRVLPESGTIDAERCRSWHVSMTLSSFS